MIDTYSIVDAHTNETFTQLRWLQEVDQPHPDTFGMVRYHNLPPLRVPKRVPVNILDFAATQNEILGLRKDYDSFLQTLQSHLESRIIPLVYPPDSEELRGVISIPDALAIRYEKVYGKKHNEEEHNNYYLQVRTWRKKDVEAAIFRHCIQMNPLPETPANSPNRAGDRKWDSAVLHNFPSKELGNAEFSRRDRPSTYHRNMTELTSFTDPLLDYGILHVEGAQIYACCYQSMQSPGCIIGYPAKQRKKPDDYLYKWFGGFAPSAETLEYRGVAYRDREKYDVLHEQIKDRIRPHLTQIQDGSYEKMTTKTLQDLARAAQLMQEYNLAFDRSLSTCPLPEELPRKRVEMLTYLRYVIRLPTKASVIIPPSFPKPVEVTKATTLENVDELWNNLKTMEMQRFSDNIVSKYTDKNLRETLVKFWRFYKLIGNYDKIAGELKTVFYTFARNTKDNIQRFWDDIEKDILLISWSKVIRDSRLLEYRLDKQRPKHAEDIKKLARVAAFPTLTADEQMLLGDATRKLDANKDADLKDILRQIEYVKDIEKVKVEPGSKYAKYIKMVKDIIAMYEKRIAKDPGDEQTKSELEQRRSGIKTQRLFKDLDLSEITEKYERVKRDFVLYNIYAEATTLANVTRSGDLETLLKQLNVLNDAILSYSTNPIMLGKKHLDNIFTYNFTTKAPEKYEDLVYDNPFVVTALRDFLAIYAKTVMENYKNLKNIKDDTLHALWDKFMDAYKKSQKNEETKTNITNYQKELDEMSPDDIYNSPDDDEPYDLLVFITNQYEQMDVNDTKRKLLTRILTYNGLVKIDENGAAKFKDYFSLYDSDRFIKKPITFEELLRYQPVQSTYQLIFPEGDSVIWGKAIIYQLLVILKILNGDTGVTFEEIKNRTKEILNKLEK